MALTLDEVRRIATLARLRLSPEDEVQFVAQLGKIVDYIDQLGEYEAIAVEDSEVRLPEARDEPRPVGSLDFFLDNAPDSLDRFLLVPQVKGGGDA